MRKTRLEKSKQHSSAMKFKKNLILSFNSKDTLSGIHDLFHSFLPIYLRLHSSPEGNFPPPCLTDQWNSITPIPVTSHLEVLLSTQSWELTAAPRTRSSPKWTLSSPFWSLGGALSSNIPPFLPTALTSRWEKKHTTRQAPPAHHHQSKPAWALSEAGPWLSPFLRSLTANAPWDSGKKYQQDSLNDKTLLS